MEQRIAVRFYENKTYGSTYGKGLYRRAIFNGTADLQEPRAKYLLDMLAYSDWENTARTTDEMEALRAAEEVAGNAPHSNLLATWIKRLDNDGSKPRVQGFGLLDLDTHQLTLLISDAAKGVEQAWKLDAKPCKQSAQNKNSPNLLATNADLN